MTWEQGFSIVNALVLPGWVLLIFLPRSKLTAAVVHSMLYPVIMGGIYLAGFIAAFAFGQSSGGVDFTSIEGVRAIFAHPNGVIVGWTHYLVFDLFAGAWIGRDAIRHQMPHIAVVPCLAATFMAGPIGLLAYLLLRLMLRRKIMLQET